MFKFTNYYVAKGFMTECIDDSCPELGKYSREISRRFSDGEVLEATEIGKDYFELTDSSSYGVSLYGSTVKIMLPVAELLNNGTLVEISEDQYRQIQNFNKAEHEYFASCSKVEYVEELVHSDDCTESDIERYVKSIIENIRMHGSYVSAKLCMN